MSNFDDAVKVVLSNEGGFVDAEFDDDVTNFGVELRLLKAMSADDLKSCNISIPVSRQTMSSLTIDQAKAVYYYVFWLKARFADIINQVACNYIFDMAVNEGIPEAVKVAQHACWAIMGEWQRLPADGILGDNTLAALAQSNLFLMPALRAERRAYYEMVVRNNPLKQADLKGWYDRTYNT